MHAQIKNIYEKMNSSENGGLISITGGKHNFWNSLKW